MNTIHRLPNHLINLIAAGEVVERPASVVKELVENCIDAGATRVDIRLGHGGTELIEIIDDGDGMTEEDLRLSIERHATSKIQDVDCLEAIETFGFRGEALSSIAAVGLLTLQSRRRGENLGHRLSVEFGTVVGAPQTVGMKEGTVVTVGELFKHLPARQKFLRSISTELAHCQRTVKELALGNPSVSFFISHNDGQAKSYVSLDRLNRTRECLKIDWEPIRVSEKGDGLELDAYLSPAHLISDRGELYVFVNGRSVRNRNLLSAVRSAYSDTLGPHHDPIGVVYIDIRSDWVDVNVHPQKTEVRILKGENLFSWIVASIRKRISKAPTQVTEAVISPNLFQETELVQPQLVRPDLFGSVPYEEVGGGSLFTPELLQANLAHTSLNQTNFERSNLLGMKVSEHIAVPEYTAVPVLPPSKLRYLGQVDAAYLVCEDDEGLLMVDQHALHEKFRFEELMKAALSGSPSVQELLVPKIVALPQDLLEIAHTATDLFAGLGMEIESVGGSDVALRSLPMGLGESEAEIVLLETLRLLLNEEDAGRLKEKFLRPYLATVACHSVVRANQRLSDAVARSLLGYLDNLEMGWTCPHGRPVLFRLSFAEMKRYFQRT